MQMFYTQSGNVVEYKLATDPIEANVWTTHRLKKSEIKIVSKAARATAALLREEILHDIISREPNPSKKSATSNDEVSQRRKAPKQQHVEAGQAKQKTRRQSKR
tara:strand:- start:3331 stop:3642 length:312 start_codon:yes stop_codon:yes gene_type:complete